MATIIFLMFLLIITGFVADYMRTFVIKRELQDCLDAAVISASQSEAAQNRSNYKFRKGDWVCHTDSEGHTSCGCENWHEVWLYNVVTTKNPLSLMPGKCVQYLGEEKRWIDYDKGSKSAHQIAVEFFQYNIQNSRIIQNNITNNKLTNIVPTFYIYNNPGDIRYPSVAGEINATLKTSFLRKIINSDMPIICKSQATTHYEVISNFKSRGLHPVPADAWADSTARRMGITGQRQMK